MTLSTDKINKKQVKDKIDDKAKKKLKESSPSPIDKLRKFLEENQGEFPQMGPYKPPPSWFKKIDPKTLPNDLERRYKNAENHFLKLSKKEKRGVSDKDMEDMANAKGGTIKVYAKGGGVRKVNY